MWGRVGPKDEKRSPPPQFLLLFLYGFFLFPLDLPYVNWASQEGCLFYLRSSNLPLFYFQGFSLLCLLTIAILDSFFLFELPNNFFSCLTLVDICVWESYYNPMVLKFSLWCMIILRSVLWYVNYLFKMAKVQITVNNKFWHIKHCPNLSYNIISLSLIFWYIIS